MATAEILQEYLVKLGFQMDAISAKKLEDTLGATNKKIFGVGVAVAGMVLAAERGVAAFAGRMEKLHYSSKLTDTSVAKLRSLSYAAEQIGISGDVASGAVQKLAQDLKLMPGTTGLVEGAFGISTKGKESADIYFELLDKMKAMSPQLGAMWAEKLFGMDQSTFLLTMGNLEKLKAKYQEHQQTIKTSGMNWDESAKKMVEYQNRLADLSANLDILGTQITTNLVSPFLESGGAIDSWIKGMIKLTSLDFTPEKGSRLDKLMTQLSGGEEGGKQEASGKIKRPEDAGHYISLPPEVRDRVLKRFEEMKTPGLRKGSTASSADVLLSSLETKHQLPPGLLDAVWKQESGRGSNMVSQKGAMGHFQFMPETAKEYGLKDPFNLEESAEAAAKKFENLLKWSKGDLPKALAAYNWGEGNVSRKGMGQLPQETQGYLRNVLGSLGNTRLGTDSAWGRQVVQNNTTNIHVSGTGAESTARAVGREQNRVLSQATRELMGRQAG